MRSGPLCCSYSPDGAACAADLVDGSSWVYDTTSWKHLYILEGHSKKVTSVAYSPNQQQIASGSADKAVRLWDANTGIPGMILQGHFDFVRSFSVFAQWLADRLWQ
jgi:WD40 repeat protein